MNLLEKPTKAIIRFKRCNEETEKNIRQVRQNVGMVFQHFHLFPHKTVLENLIYAPIM